MRTLKLIENANLEDSPYLLIAEKDDMVSLTGIIKLSFNVFNEWYNSITKGGVKVRG